MFISYIYIYILTMFSIAFNLGIIELCVAKRHCVSTHGPKGQAQQPGTMPTHKLLSLAI